MKKNAGNIDGNSLKKSISFEILDRWLTLKRCGKSLSVVLNKKNINRIAIYGGGVVGHHLFYDLKAENIEVAYFIDKHLIGTSEGIEILSFRDNWREVDAIVVTPVFYYEIIKKEIELKVKYPVISLEELLEEAWDGV
jgi:hypothetical protein